MTLVKICGITNAADALDAVAAGADALGFNFWPRSPRFVPEAARLDLLRSVPAGVLKVGVFVDTPAAEMDRVAEELGLDVVQLHGTLDGDPRTPLWQAVSAGAPGWRETMESSKAAAFLLDTPSGAERGGTGRTFDWALLDGITQRIVLAGGLGPGNVAAAVQRVRPWGVDACSRLESAPGKKDASKVRDFIEAVRKTATMSTPTQLPDARGHFGPYGGRYVPETLMAPLEELERAYLDAQNDPAFQSELKDLLANYAGRPTPLYEAKRLSEQLGGARIFIKREDLLHTGAHKINNALGQALLARRMGKKRIIAETGAGQHGVATATVCALFGLNCTVYMGEEDMRRQRLNVFRMRLLGANVVGVNNGSRTLKDAISEAMRDWVTNVESTYYLLGSALGAHPYPMMVRDFHRCMGDEARAQILERTGALPGSVFACVGGGSNAIGIFAAFVGDANVKLIGIEAGGRGSGIGEHAARFSGGAPGVLHGAYSYLLQDAEGQVSLTHSISAGLDYALIGPEHAYLHDQGRADYVSINDGEALEAAKTLARTEGIIPALESSHAVAEALKRAPAAKGEIFLINLSGRGDKDTDIYRENLPELDTPVA